MPTFIWQTRTEPLSTTPEATTVDRWLPTWVQPVRAAANIAALTSGMAAPVFVPAAATPNVAEFQPTLPPPTRGPLYRAASTVGAPVSTASETTSIDRWNPVWPQPRQTVVFVRGAESAAPVAVTPEVTSVDRWLSTWPQPKRTRSTGLSEFAFVPVITSAPVVPPIDGWLPTIVQPSRAPSSNPGTTSVSPLVDIPTVDRWLATFPQPDRTPPMRSTYVDACRLVVVVSTSGTPYNIYASKIYDSPVYRTQVYGFAGMRVAMAGGGQLP